MKNKILQLKKLNFNRVKIFDGFENQLFESDFSIEIENKTIPFIAYDLTPNKLIHLDFYSQIIDDLDLVNNKSITTKDRLEVYYLKSENLLIIFSMGEYQSGRYMLFLEGVYHLKKENVQLK